MSKEKYENNNNIIESNEESEIIPMPEEIISEIFKHLDKDSRDNLALAHSMFGRSAAQNDRSKKKNEHFTMQLFTLAGLADQDEMEKILKERPEFLRVYAPLKDISGCVFKNITLFQHALWTGDVRYMANMMLDCLQNHPGGESIRQELLRQYHELMEKGLSYELYGQSFQEKQFSLQPLIEALTTYVKNYNNWTYEQYMSHWCTQVGFSQTLLPAHIRQHYCDPDESFWNTPTFRKEKFTRSLGFYNFIQSSYQLWNESLVGLGFEFGICGVGAGPLSALRAGGAQRAAAAGAGRDLVAIEALCKVRTEDLQTLIQRLQNPIQYLEKDQEPRYTIS